MHDDETMHSNQILASLPTNKQPEPTMCTHCPNAMWRIQDEKPHCFCRLMSFDSYDGNHPDKRILKCDGLFRDS